MSTRKKPSPTRPSLPQQILKSIQTLTKGLVNWLLRSLLILKRTSRLNPGGFVLPTVVMVMLVVILITTAILFRSFDRSKNASNYRVNEAVLNAASPALDRARAKIEALFQDPVLPRGTPPDTKLYDAFLDSKYDFGDETRLKLLKDIDGDNTIEKTTLSNGTELDETLRTAWKYPVDTDNNGKFDSYTLYGIYFKNPPRDAADSRKFARARTAVEARGLPMNEGASPVCTGATSASAVDGSDWFQTNGKLKKAFFVYTATIPITTPPTGDIKYEPYKGNKGFSALEMQQDRLRIPLNNNAVWFQDDVSVSRATDFRLNGRVHTNGNLLVAGTGSANRVRFYQVSSRASCFYEPVNSKIVVAGNTATGDTSLTTDGSQVEVHLYQGTDTDPTGVNNTANGINSSNKSTTATGGARVGFYAEAYNQRLQVLVDGALNLHDKNNFPSYNPATDPLPQPTIATVSNAANKFDEKDIVEKYRDLQNPVSPATARNDLSQVLKAYFKDRLRQVPYAEIPYPNASQAVVIGGEKKTSDPDEADTGEGFIFSGTTGNLKPPQTWMLIEDATNGSATNYTNLALRYNANNTQDLEATDPDLVRTDPDKKENHIGDRIVVGNNLPGRWYKPTDDKFADLKEGQLVFKTGTTTIKWNPSGTGDPDATIKQRQRTSQVETLEGIDDTSRGGFWEQASAKSGTLVSDKAAGGLRIVTGAGIYIDGTAVATGATGGTGVRVLPPAVPPTGNSFLPAPPQPVALTPAVTGYKKIPGIGTDSDPVKVPEIFTYKAANYNTTVVWPDSMPMFNWMDSNNNGVYDVATTDKYYKGDLQMRATVVYHYAQGAAYRDTNQVPIACVSSYYDPTNYFTARDVSATLFPPSVVATSPLISNNGAVYAPPYTTQAARIAATNTYKTKLGKQAAMVFPNGRFVNPQLRTALQKIDDGQPLNLADNSAIDSTVCALKIQDGSAVASTAIPANAIRERSFLDGRQIQAIHKLTLDTSNNPITTPVATLLADIANPNQLKITDTNKQLKPSYDLPLEQRQPQEIRVTELDIAALRTKTMGTATTTSYPNNNQEYLIPNSGIIYASRDDALPDSSSSVDPNQPTDAELLVSGSDFKLDPTRRPNGIRLFNGSNLSRDNVYRIAEKGFILASNIPVYIKGEFNSHVRPNGTTVREEFLTPLTSTNFYSRGVSAMGPGGDRNLNPNFACRQGQSSTCTQGDQWRAATILSDAITLLSGDTATEGFVDGYREQGDFDLRNNTGNLAVETRLKNGFWWNNYVTNALWWNSTNTGTTPYPDGKTLPNNGTEAKTYVGSYLLNGVTPIQRRTTFPEYKMEICRKLPVSECTPSDWDKAGAGTTGNVVTTLTAPPPTNPNAIAKEDRVYPRRVAFQRDPAAFNQLVLTPPTTSAPKATAIPLKPDGSPLAYSDPNPTNLPKNVLWFWTTSNNADPSATPSYNSDKKLYYYEDQESAGEKQLLLPGAPEFPIATAIPSLNGTTDIDPSDYAVCIPGTAKGKGATKDYKVKTITPPAVLPDTAESCPTTTANRIPPIRTALATTVVTPANASVLAVTPFPTTLTASLVATKKVNIYELPTNGNITATNIILSRGTQDNPIFVFRRPSAAPAAQPIRFNGGSGGVQLTLNGVDPNNVFWVSKSGMTFTNKPHKLAGNFIGGNTPASYLRILGTNPSLKINGGRFLGFSRLTKDNTANPPNTSFLQAFPTGVLTALVTTDQPLLVPMLQLHSPDGVPATGNGAFGISAFNDKWLQHAVETKYNAALIMGDTPPRPTPVSGTTGTTSESNGGLVNFPRFLEAWEIVDTNTPEYTAAINGSFIQFRKSFYATAPFEAINPATTDTSLFYETADYMTGVPGAATGFRYKGGGASRNASYYRPPNRNWGFDVGLLSQSPDLFSQRFTTPPAGLPNEFFREAGRDDPWIQTLLCATQKPNAAATTYVAIPNIERPSNCPAPVPASIGG